MIYFNERLRIFVSGFFLIPQATWSQPLMLLTCSEQVQGLNHKSLILLCSLRSLNLYQVKYELLKLQVLLTIFVSELGCEVNHSCMLKFVLKCLKVETHAAVAMPLLSSLVFSQSACEMYMLSHCLAWNPFIPVAQFIWNEQSTAIHKDLNHLCFFLMHYLSMSLPHLVYRLRLAIICHSVY